MTDGVPRRTFSAWHCWKVPLPAMAHEAIARRDDGTQDLRYRITLRGDGPLYVADYQDVEGDRPTVMLRSIDRDVWFMELLGMLTPPASDGSARKPEPKPKPEAQRAPARKRAFCTACGQTLSRGKTFCTKCGAAVKGVSDETPVVAQVLTDCRACGAPLKPGRGFCTKCGAPVA